MKLPLEGPAMKAEGEPESWEDDGHLFLKGVKLHIGDKTVCLKCYKVFEDCFEGQPCESQKEGKWTDIGIEAILTTLREGDDREIIRIPGEVAEIIEQLRRKAESSSSSQDSLRVAVEMAALELKALQSKQKEYPGEVNVLWVSKSATDLVVLRLENALKIIAMKSEAGVKEKGAVSL